MRRSMICLATFSFLLALPATAEEEVQYFPVQAGDHPHDVAPAPDGTVWYTGQQAGVLGRLDRKIGSVERAFVTDSGLNAIVRFDPASKEVKVWPLSKAGINANLNTPAFDAKGRVWFTGQSGLYGRLDPTTGAMDVWDAPRGVGPYGITGTPQGEIYCVSLAGSFLGKPDLETGETEVIEPRLRRPAHAACGQTPRVGFGSASGTPAMSAFTRL
jgi:virginiamycin B lyase